MAAAAQLKTLRSAVSGNRPLGHVYGEVYVNLADLQIGCVDSTGTPKDFVAVRYWSSNTNYAGGDFAVQGGTLYVAKVAIPAGGGFNPAQWNAVLNASQLATGYLPLGGGTLTGKLNVIYPTTNTEAARVDWVQTWANSGFLPFAGGTLTGPLTLKADPTTALQAATKQYVDARDNTRLPLAGGTMTGSLYPIYTPTFNDVARADWVRDWTNSQFLPLAGGTVSGNLSVTGTMNANTYTGTILSLTNYGYATKYFQANQYYANKNVYAGVSFSGPYLCGGVNNGGSLLSWTGGNIITFDWTGPSIQFVIDDTAVYQTIVYETNAQNLQLLSGGGPRGIQLNVNTDDLSSVYGFYADVASDRRIKENIKDSTIDALTLVTKLKVREFDYTDEYLVNTAKAMNPVHPAPKIANIQKDPEAPDGWLGKELSIAEKEKITARIKRNEEEQAAQDAAVANSGKFKHVNMGFITQEVLELIPEMVGLGKTEEDLQHIILKNAVPYLVKAIQQLSAKVADLEQQLARK